MYVHAAPITTVPKNTAVPASMRLQSYDDVPVEYSSLKKAA